MSQTFLHGIEVLEVAQATGGGGVGDGDDGPPSTTPGSLDFTTADNAVYAAVIQELQQ